MNFTDGAHFKVIDNVWKNDKIPASLILVILVFAWPLACNKYGSSGKKKYFNLGKRFLIRITCLSPPLLPLLPEGLPPLQEHGGVVHPGPGAHQDRNLLLNLRGFFFWGK